MRMDQSEIMDVHDAVLLLKAQDLSVEIAALEELTADVHKKLAGGDIPQWHKDILDERLSNQEKFSPWEAVKTRIQNGAKG
jgi:hypothetical protein